MVSKVPFEDALNLTGFGKFNYMMMLLNINLIAAMAFEIFSVAYLVPASACELLTTNFQQGLMAGMPFIGTIIASHFWGYLADTRGRRKALCVSMLLGFVTGASAALSPNWIVFSILKLISCGAVSGTYALALSLLGECTPAYKRPTFIAITSSIYLFVSGLMAVLTIPILPLTFSYYIPVLDIHFNSWRLLNLIYALPCAIGAIGVTLAFESPKFLLSIDKEEEALEVLQRIFVMNTGKTREEFQANSLTLDEDNATRAKGLWSSLVSQTVPLLKPPLLKNTLLLSTLFGLVYFCMNPYSVWLPYVVDGIMRSQERGDEDLTLCEMLRSSQNVTMSQNTDCSLNHSAMIIVFTVNLFFTTLNLFMSVIINTFGRKRLVIGFQMLCGLAGLFVNISNNWIISGLLFMSFVAGILNFGFLATFSVDLFPTYVKAMAVCLTIMVGRASAVVGINLLKNMLVNSCEASFYFFGSLTVCGGVIAFLLPADNKPSKHKSESDTKSDVAIESNSCNSTH